jgi:hypothetical protein
MARRYSASQIRSIMRQAESKRRQAINKYNQAVRQHNQQVRTAVNKYNQSVRNYNARVRAHRQRVRDELSRLRRQRTTVRFKVYRASVDSLYESYERLERRADSEKLDPTYNRVLDLSEREVANSLAVANRLDDGDSTDSEADPLEDAQLLDKLRQFSPDLDDRWQGAVFALHPKNPDAARHFCTSAREIIAQILELKAPDENVFQLLPACEKTDQGKPTRRSKLRYLLDRKGLSEPDLAEFVEHDMDNIVALFRMFNDGTHGSAGTFTLVQLNEIRKRVEDGINFLTEISNT